jgi:hypothetical protein
VKSGQKFTLKTSDPIRLPLPSKELLELQWHLNRIVSMSAAAEVRDEEDDEDNGDGSVIMRQDLHSNVEAWIESSVPPASSPALPLSHSDSESGSEEFDQSFTTTSTGPSPVKTRDTAVQSTEQSTSCHEQSLSLPLVNQ